MMGTSIKIFHLQSPMLHPVPLPIDMPVGNSDPND